MNADGEGRDEMEMIEAVGDTGDAVCIGFAVSEPCCLESVDLCWLKSSLRFTFFAVSCSVASFPCSFTSQ